MSWSTDAYDFPLQARPGFEPFPAIMVAYLLSVMQPLSATGADVQDAQIILYHDLYLQSCPLHLRTPVMEFFDLCQFYLKHPSEEFMRQCLGGLFVPRPFQPGGRPQSAALRLAGFFKVFLGLDCTGKNFDAFWIFMRTLPFSPYTSFAAGAFPIDDAALQLMTAELADFMRLVLLLSMRFSFLYEARDFLPASHVSACMPLDGPARWIYDSPAVDMPDFRFDCIDFLPSAPVVSSSGVLSSPVDASSMVMPAAPPLLVVPVEVAVSVAPVLAAPGPVSSAALPSVVVPVMLPSVLPAESAVLALLEKTLLSLPALMNQIIDNRFAALVPVPAPAAAAAASVPPALVNNIRSPRVSQHPRRIGGELSFSQSLSLSHSPTGEDSDDGSCSSLLDDTSSVLSVGSKVSGDNLQNILFIAQQRFPSALDASMSVFTYERATFAISSSSDKVILLGLDQSVQVLVLRKKDKLGQAQHRLYVQCVSGPAFSHLAVPHVSINSSASFPFNAVSLNLFISQEISSFNAFAMSPSNCFSVAEKNALLQFAYSMADAFNILFNQFLCTGDEHKLSLQISAALISLFWHIWNHALLFSDFSCANPVILRKLFEDRFLPHCHSPWVNVDSMKHVLILFNFCCPDQTKQHLGHATFVSASAVDTRTSTCSCTPHVPPAAGLVKKSPKQPCYPYASGSNNLFKHYNHKAIDLFYAEYRKANPQQKARIDGTARDAAMNAFVVSHLALLSSPSYTTSDAATPASSGRAWSVDEWYDHLRQNQNLIVRPSRASRGTAFASAGF